ncbi:MAG: DUF3131 domain-containing protein, partial [Clostridiales bacterium]|nr:DUF3131 domain-containing protein [Clostridiales bacterium]
FLACALPVFRYAIWLAVLPQLLRMVFAFPALFLAPVEFFKEVARCVFEWAMLPTVAVYTLCAVCVTLGRLCTRRNLLEWRVFAQDRGEIGMLANSVAALTLAAVIAVFSRSLLFFIPALLFAAGPTLAEATAKARETTRSDALEATLYDTAKRTFAYFQTQEKFALPCDCFQEDNGLGFVMRTSPTNIGMELLAYASAYEIGLIDKDTLARHIGKRLSTLETLKTYKGNLYNWYDCDSLEPLPPHFVSSVDSGNLLACLYAVRSYTDGTLSQRLDAYIDKINLCALYDEERCLLYIGYDADAERFTPNHYDLLGSESSLSYLIGCASGKLPLKAYLSLNRVCVKSGNARTLYSWTGGAFEYFMTRLFVSPPRGSLLHGAYHGAAKAHRRYAKKAHSEVWGVSECRYNAFDENGGNLYRAFGVQGIAYSEVPEKPSFAPYAACLALPYTPPAESQRNLAAFSEKVYGRFGFYESVDKSVPVKSYMTHHQGMILAAIASAVKPNGLVRRLQSQAVWRGVRILCGEEMPRARTRTLPPRRTKSENAPREAYLCKCGPLGVAVAGREEVYAYRNLRLFEQFRVFAFEDGARVELTAGARSYGDAVHATITENALTVQSALFVLSSPLGVSLNVTLRNLSTKERHLRVVGCAQPVLAPYADFDSHPAYSKLFLETGGETSYMWARPVGYTHLRAPETWED